MKIIKFATVTAAALLTVAAVAHADDVTVVHVWQDPGQWWGNRFVYSSANLYTANELTLDLFGAYGAAEHGLSHVFDTDIRRSRGGANSAGGGIGLNYFFEKHLGLGVDTVALNNNGNFIDSVNGSLILRLPIEPTGLAPYIYGGGGRNTEIWQWSAHAGAGLEYRFNPGTGIFADARYTWGEHAYADNLLIRGGLRFAF